MPRLRQRAGIRSERDGTQGRAREGDIARRAVSLEQCRESEQGRWRVVAEPVARPREKLPAMGAERPNNGGGRTRPCRLHRQAKRAESDSERSAPGIVTRRAKTAKRASWSRAGRSRARRNRARRPVRRTGRAPLCSGWRYERYRTCVYHRWGRLTGRRSRGLAGKGLKRLVVGGARCDHGKSETRGSCRWWRAKRGTRPGTKKGRSLAEAKDRPRRGAGETASRGDAHHRDTELPRLVDQVPGDA